MVEDVSLRDGHWQQLQNSAHWWGHFGFSLIFHQKTDWIYQIIKWQISSVLKLELLPLPLCAVVYSLPIMIHFDTISIFFFDTVEWLQFLMNPIAGSEDRLDHLPAACCVCKLGRLPKPPETLVQSASEIQVCTVVLSRCWLLNAWTYPQTESEKSKVWLCRVESRLVLMKAVID